MKWEPFPVGDIGDLTLRQIYKLMPNVKDESDPGNRRSFSTTIRDLYTILAIQAAM